MSFLSHLSRRLAEGEHAFLAGRIAAADECAHDVLRDLVSLTGRSGSGSGSSRLLRAREHECARGCVCEAAVLLALQCAAETRGPEAVDDIVRDCYAKPIYLPFNIFTVWVQYELSVQRYEECCQQIIAYIDTHYSTAGGGGGGGSSAIAPDLLLQDADPAVADARYVSLLEMLLFDVLVPLGSHDEAVSFLRRGRKARRGQAAPPRDERLAPHIKESWINELLDLKAAGYTHALAACEQLASTNALIAAPVDATAAASSSYYAGLAALHDSAGYSSRSSGALLLPPSNLPDGASTALVHRHDEEHIDDSDDGPGGAVSLTDSDSAASTGAAASLRPYPALQPLLPDPWSSSFVWSAWVASYGHRLYAALHPHAPRLANRMRAMVHWMWTRRGPVIALLLLYLCARLLSILLRFFRLSDLPGVRLLIDEARNFIRIAFISGTGRSLFA